MPTQASEIDFSIRHPLHHEWVMSYELQTKGSEWGKNRKTLKAFDCVEDFWRIFNNMVAVDRLPDESMYCCFKRGIEPKWEDKANDLGGRWVINLSLHEANDAWQKTLLAVIGETVRGTDDINGCILEARRNRRIRLSLWIRDAGNADNVKSIGEDIAKSLDLRQPISFNPFKREKFPYAALTLHGHSR